MLQVFLVAFTKQMYLINRETHGGFQDGTRGARLPSSAGPRHSLLAQNLQLASTLCAAKAVNIYLQLLTHLAYLSTSGYKAGVSLAFFVPHSKGAEQTWGQQGQQKPATCHRLALSGAGRGASQGGACVSGPRDC